MADIKITELPQATSVSDSDELIIQQPSGTKRAGIADLPVGSPLSAGDGINITNDVISVINRMLPVSSPTANHILLTDPSGQAIDSGKSLANLQELLTAGRGIQISQNSISNVFETLYSPNLNDIKYNYQSYVYNAANKPSNVNGSGKLISVFSGGDTASHGVQMFSPYNNNDLYIRSYNTSTSTWTSWEKIQKSPELLWTNASVSSPFSAQTISLDLSRYNGVWIVFASTNSSNSQYNSILLFDNLRYRIEFVEPTSETYGLIVVSSRIVTKTNNGLAFDVGSQATTLGFADNDNTRIIPYKIYGV